MWCEDGLRLDQIKCALPSPDLYWLIKVPNLDV